MWYWRGGALEYHLPYYFWPIHPPALAIHTMKARGDGDDDKDNNNNNSNNSNDKVWDEDEEDEQ